MLFNLRTYAPGSNKTPAKIIQSSLILQRPKQYKNTKALSSAKTNRTMDVIGIYSPRRALFKKFLRLNNILRNKFNFQKTTIRVSNLRRRVRTKIQNLNKVITKVLYLCRYFLRQTLSA